MRFLRALEGRGLLPDPFSFSSIEIFLMKFSSHPDMSSLSLSLRAILLPPPRWSRRLGMADWARDPWARGARVGSADWAREAREPGRLMADVPLCVSERVDALLPGRLILAIPSIATFFLLLFLLLFGAACLDSAA